MRLFLSILACTATAFAADEPGDAAKAAANSAETSLKSLAIAPGLRVDLWASEPLLKDPVAFTFDNEGRAYIAETGRRRSSMQDIRKNDDWVIENLALRSVEDRIAFLKRKLAPELKRKPNSSDRQDLNKDGQFDWRDLEFETETIRVVEDTDGDGKADATRVLAEGFNALPTGIGAGLVVGPDGNLYYTCVPDLWLIKRDGTKERLSTGYGIHVVYSGHDMHGLRIGPDGRVYFSIGDCGASVRGSDGKAIECPDSGAVFRSWPDGSGLELFAKGLRNPQHLAFNDLGDLFTSDNNADGGDKARLIQVIEGADYGWRIGFQFMPGLGVWNSEGMWKLDAGETNPAILPPIAHIGHGPAGFSFYPGTGLPEQYRDHFFMADFPGGIRAFKLKQKGATYEVDGFAGDAPILQDNSPAKMTGKLLWNLDPSDVQFAPGGGVYVLDWTKGWEKSGRGRIFRVHDPATDASAIVQEAKRLLGEDFAKRRAEDLAKLLGHADQRVRMKAQFEFRTRLLESQKDVPLLVSVAKGEGPLVGKLHAVWSLFESAPLDSAANKALIALIEANDPEVRVQALRSPWLLGTDGFYGKVVALLDDPSPRVQLAAIQMIAKHAAGHRDSLEAAAARVSAFANGAEPFLRQAATRAAAHLYSRPHKLAETGTLAAVLALRTQGSGEIATLLTSANPRVGYEAARAIHDEPIFEAMPALAALLDGSQTSGLWGQTAGQTTAPLSRRVVNANYRVGTADCAKRLAAAAANTQLPEPIRTDALDALMFWSIHLGRDRVIGSVFEGDGKRDRAGAADALAPVSATLLADKSNALRIATLNALGANKATAADPTIAAIANDPAQPGPVRAAALIALDRLDSGALAGALKLALESTDATILETARRISTNRTPGLALDGIIKLLKKGAPSEQRQAIHTLGHLDQKGADEQLGILLNRMKTGALPPALHLDVLEASALRDDTTVKTLLSEWDKARKAGDPLARWRECLEGGDAAAGRTVFAEKAEAGCQRCHAVNKVGGDVGPELAGIGTRQNREALLRAIVLPDAEIAPGYENVLVTLNDGSVIAGILTAEDAATLTLKNVADGKPQAVTKAGIKDRTKLPSAMIPGLGEVLTKRELRDLMEFLATLK